MWVDASRGSDDALEHIWVLLRALQQAPEHRQDLEAHNLFVLVWECRGCKGLGDEVGSPAPQLEGGVWGGKGQDAVHDGLVVAGVDEDGLAGVIQLLELLAHGLHSVGGHDGQVCWHDGLSFLLDRVKGRHARSTDLNAPLLYEFGRGTDGLAALQAKDSRRGSVGGQQSPVSDSMGFARVRVSGSGSDRPEAQPVVAGRRWQSTMSRCDAGRCDADIDQDGGGAYFGRFQRCCRAVAGSSNGLTDRADARSWACPRSGLRWEPMKTCPRFSRSNGVVDWVDGVE